MLDGIANVFLPCLQIGFGAGHNRFSLHSGLFHEKSPVKRGESNRGVAALSTMPRLPSALLPVRFPRCVDFRGCVRIRRTEVIMPRGSNGKRSLKDYQTKRNFKSTPEPSG